MGCFGILLLWVGFMNPTANYSVERALVDGIDVIRLSDARNRIEVSVVPSIGNNAYDMKVNGKPILWSPYTGLRELKDKPIQVGNPFLAPWANRIDGEAYWANGKKYLLNPELKNFRYDNNRKPIHGLLVHASTWKVVEVKADSDSARVTSRLEFWREPDLMAQFPFAHTITMTYRLKDGSLEVETTIENDATETMPLSLGYHTYYRLNDSRRDDWKVHVPAGEIMELSKELIPTGKKTPVSLPDPATLRERRLDDIFTSLVRDPSGRAEFWVQGQKEKIRVLFGPKYDVGIVWAPPGREFICFEPMAGPTNAFNLAHTGIFKNLQTIPPGGTWKESFWIIPEGF